MTSRAAAAVVVTLGLAVAPPVATAAPAAGNEPTLSRAAQRHLDEGLAAYAREDYSTASRELEAAYAIDAHPSLLYAWAQSERRGGRCEHAVALYQQYIATQPKQEQIDAANAGIKGCAAASGSAAEPPVSSSPPWARAIVHDPPVAAMLGGAILGGVVGAIALSSAEDNISAAKSASTLAAIHAGLSAAATDQTIAGVSLLVTAGLAAGGILLFRHHRAEHAYVATDGHVVAVGARF